MKRDMNTRAAIARIRELLGGDSLEDCRTAVGIYEDLTARDAVDDRAAMMLCAMILHGFCSIQDDLRAIDAEKALADLRRAAKSCLIDDNGNAGRLLDGLSAIRPDDRRAGCIARVRRDFMALPDAFTRMKLLLTLQFACAAAVVDWRGEGWSGALMYDHLGRSLFEEYDDGEPGRCFHDADGSQTLRGETAEALEQALFEAMERDLGEIGGPRARSENDGATISGWHRLCSEETIKRALEEYDAIHVDASGRYKYRCPVPGACVILGSLSQGGRNALDDYVVPAMIDGVRVRCVEHIPDVKCGTLRFEEGIEEISLRGFRGEVNRLILPDSLVRVREGSFQCLPSLREIAMNGAVLESRAFAHCVNLERVRFGPKLWSVMDGAFEGCLRLKHAAFPDKMFSIGEGAFSGCAVERLVLPEMTHLMDGAFRRCASLETVRFTGDIEDILGDPFAECDRLKRFVDTEKTRGLTFVNGALIHTIEDTVSPIFTRSGKEETQIYTRAIHNV